MLVVSSNSTDVLDCSYWVGVRVHLLAVAEFDVSK